MVLEEPENGQHVWMVRALSQDDELFEARFARQDLDKMYVTSAHASLSC